MHRYVVEYSLVIEVDAEDCIDAVGRADEIADLKDAFVYVDGNLWD